MELACTACDKRFDLSADYITAHGGGAFACDCGQTVTIPTTAELPAEVGALLFPLPSRGRILNTGIWAHGVHVVVVRGTKLPKTCCRCNMPVDSTKTRSLEWIPPEARRRIRVLRIVAAMMATTQAKSIAIRVGKCARHDWEPIRRWVAFALLWMGIACFVLTFITGLDYAGDLLTAALILLTGAGVVHLLPDSIAVAHVQGDRFWITGFGDDYLDALPRYVEAVAVDRAAAVVDLDRVE